MTQRIPEGVQRLADDLEALRRTEPGTQEREDQLERIHELVAEAHTWGLDAPLMWAIEVMADQST